MKKVIMFANKEVDNKSININEILVFDDVIKGLKELNNKMPDYLIIDIDVSRISFIDCIKIIRSNPRFHHMKIIITSKVYHYSVFKKAYNYGADYFIKSPFNVLDIEKLIITNKRIDTYYDIENVSSMKIRLLSKLKRMQEKDLIK